MADRSPVDKPELIACITGGEEAIDAFLRAAQPSITDAAYKISRRLSVTTRREIEEIRSIVSEHAWKLAASVKGNPADAKTGHTLESMLVRRALPAATRHIAQFSSAPSGVIGISRKSHLLDQMRAELAQKLGRNPTDAEVVTAHNERMYAQRANPKKQGVIATIDDVGLHRRIASTPVTISSADSPEEAAGGSSRLDRAGFAADINGASGPRSAADHVIAPFEGKKFHSCLVAAAEQTDQRLGSIASRWVELIEAGNSEDDTARLTSTRSGRRIVKTSIITILSEEFTLDEHQARNAVGLIRDLARDVLAEQMGITAADV